MPQKTTIVRRASPVDEKSGELCIVGRLYQSINQSINQFISRHSTEARATVWLWWIKEKCLEMDLKCASGWSSSTVCGRDELPEEFQRQNEQWIQGQINYTVFQKKW